jgi:hypothetical protein
MFAKRIGERPIFVKAKIDKGENRQQADAGTPSACMKPAGAFLRLDCITAFTYKASGRMISTAH